MKKLSIEKNIKMKTLSLITAVVMVCNALPISRLAEIVAPYFAVVARAEDYSTYDEITTDQLTTFDLRADPEYTCNKNPEDFSAINRMTCNRQPIPPKNYSHQKEPC